MHSRRLHPKKGISLGSIRHGVQGQKENYKRSGCHQTSSKFTNRKYSERELEIINQALDHENIVSIPGYFPLLGRIYIVMEFCEGGDLQDYIINNEPKLKERFNLMTDMGFCTFIVRTIVHRDLKPET